MKSTLLYLFGVLSGVYIARRISARSSYTSLENIRRGVQNKWYRAESVKKDGSMYYVRLVGQDTEGIVSDGYYPITEETFISLTEDGVHQE